MMIWLAAVGQNSRPGHASKASTAILPYPTTPMIPAAKMENRMTNQYTKQNGAR